MVHMVLAFSLFVLAMAWTVVAVIKGLGKDSKANDPIKWGVLWLVVAMVLAGSAESINTLDLENMALRNDKVSAQEKAANLELLLKDLEKRTGVPAGFICPDCGH